MFDHDFSVQFPLHWKYYAILYTILTLTMMSSSTMIRKYFRTIIKELNSYLLSFAPFVFLIYMLYIVVRL